MPPSPPALSPTPAAPPLASRRGRLQCGAAGLIVAVALLDLLRWQAHPAAWTHFDVVLPMAPALAGMFALLGTALGLHLLRPDRRWTHRLAVGLVMLTVAGAVHALLCHLGGEVPRWETWLGTRPLTVDGFVLGHLSSQSAVLVLLSCLALAGLLVPPDSRARLPQAGVFAALLVGLFVLAAVMSYAVGSSPLTNDGWLKIAPLAVVEFAVFNFVLLLRGRATNRLRHWFFGADPADPDFAPVAREERLVFLLLTGAGLLALAASLAYLRFETRHYRERNLEVLQRLADLKAGQIEQWRRERLGDARSLMRLPGLGGNVKAVGAPGQAAQRARFTGWLQHYVRNYNYANIVLFDATLQPVWSEPGGMDPPTAELRERLRLLRPDSDVVELPPYVDGAGQLHWDLLVPLAADQSPLLEGAILLQTNPGQRIIPLLQSWPAEYQTGQSMLWYRDGNRLLSLGGYRPAPGVTSDELRPFGMIRDISDPSAQSLLSRVARGELSSGEARDHRGLMILGLGRPIANSSWLLSSRVDSAEVYAPLRRGAIGLAGSVAGLLAITGFAMSQLWRQRQKNLLHERLAAELEQKRLEARLGLVMQHAKDIIMVTDGNQRFVDVNQRAVDTYGWTREELLQRGIADIRAPETMGHLSDDLERADLGEGVTYETANVRRDGTRFPVEVSIRRVEIDGRPHRLAIIRDISERKEAEAQLRRSEEKFSRAFQANPSGIAITELASGRIIEVNDSWCRTMGYSPPEAIGRTSVELGAWSNVDDRRRMAQALLDGKPFRNFEMQTRTRAGEMKTVLISAELVELNGQRCVLALFEDITERKRAEAALRESRERFSKAFQANPSGIVINDLATGRTLEVNESFCRMMGYAPQDVIGRTAVELGLWANAEERSRALKPLLEGRPLRNFEIAIRTKAGEPRITLLHADAIDLNGQRCTVVVIEDITDRKRAEAALRASEERYRLIAENTSDIIWLYDLVADSYSYVSPAVLGIRGYRPEEVIGKKLSTAVAPASVDKVQRLLEAELAALAASGVRRSVVVEIEQTHKDGGIVPTEVVASVLTNAAGRPTHILGVSRDITERRRVQETLEKFNSELEQRVDLRTAELAARNSEIEALLDSIPDTVLLCDGTGAITFTHSPAGREGAVPFAGQDGPGGPGPLWREIAREMHALFRAAREPVVREFERPAHGATVSIEARATPAGSDRLLIFLRDISARKRLEQDMVANLEREKQLSEMKSQFVSVASHEFRTPLAAATGSLELLERHANRMTEAKRLELLTRARRSLGRLTTIMDNVLQLSRADSGRVKVKRITVDLVQIVQDLIREVEAGDGQRHAFAFLPSGRKDAVPVDTNLLNHILSNLLGNAVRYSPAGTAISVALEIGAATFAVTVADEGIGIPEAERDRVFEPFARGSNVGQISGTGLGLNIVKRYTEMMGGRIELRPTARGATFRIEVPLVEPASSACS